MSSGVFKEITRKYHSIKTTNKSMHFPPSLASESWIVFFTHISDFFVAILFALFT